MASPAKDGIRQTYPVILRSWNGKPWPASTIRACGACWNWSQVRMTSMAPHGQLKLAVEAEILQRNHWFFA